jgi:hypothetical protein
MSLICVLAVFVHAASGIAAPDDEVTEAEQPRESIEDGSEWAPQTEITAEEEPAAACECPGGITCDGTHLTGRCGQVVCGQDFRDWKCYHDGWKQFGSDGCTC